LIAAFVLQINTSMNILELDSYNLADAVKFNKTLNPKIWAGETMRPEVREKLLAIAEDFKEFLGLSDIEVKDITVSGSNANYSYTPYSDIDLHLVVDIPRADNDEVYRELFDAKKYQYNDLHDYKIGGYDVELYVENANEPPVSKGVYSILNSDWINIPRKIRSEVNDNAVRSKYEDLKHRIDNAIASDDSQVIDRLAKKIKDLRQAGLDAHGELGAENLAYKMLRTQGKIKELYDARNAAKDQELSLKERAPKEKFTYGFKEDVGMSWDGVSPTTKMFLSEEPPELTDEEVLRDFIKFCVQELKIEALPKVKLRRDPQWSVRNKTFGRYINDIHTLEVAFGQRHIMDVLRTVAHELTHKHQHERDGAKMGADAGETGSPWENEANARAGILMRDYGRLHPELFDSSQTELGESASGYIPTKKQANDPRFKMALTKDIRPGQLGKEANKLKLKTDSQGHPQIANPNGLFEKLALELNQFKRRGTVLESEQLDEVSMRPSSLKQFANSEEAKGIQAGFEAELIFRDTTSDENDGEDMEPDYDMDERCRSISQVVEFFQDDEYGYGLTERQASRLQDSLDEQYMEWSDEQMYDAWRDERDELIKDAWLREKSMDERIHAALVDGLDLTDAQADAVVKLHDDRASGKIKGSEMSDEQLEMASQYSEAVSIAEDILQEDVEQTIEKEDGFYDEVLDDFRSNFYVDDDSGFFDDVGLRWMSDVANSYDLGWPYLTGGGGNDGSRSWEEIGDSLQQAVDMPVKVSSGYHSATRKPGLWIVEPDSSLEPDDREDYGLEIVSPPMPLEQALEKLKQVADWANREGDAYTNSSTGLHMGVSVPYKGGDVDYLKLILFLGDEYVLKSFGRQANTYTKSAMSKFKENIKGGRTDPMSVIKLMQHGLLELAQREVQKGVGEGKYTSAHKQNKYIEFRSAGGDWLAGTNPMLGEADDGFVAGSMDKLQNTMMRYAYAMYLASRPDLERREYAKKLYKLIAPEGDSQLALFSQYAAGELTAEQLKKQWAEKTIGKEKKMNQRWKLFQFDKVADQWLPVPGAEWNGYTEDQVKNAVWSKYGREALDSGEYELRNMSEDQQWEVYDVNTGDVLEIVKGKNKGEVADKVYDKYKDQGIGFNVRPYEDPTTLTPRAKLAKRIAQPKQEPDQTVDMTPGNWEFFYEPTGRVLDAVSGVSTTQARAVLADVQRRYNDLAAPSIKMRKTGEAAPDVAQNFSQNPNPTAPIANQVRMPNGVPVWELFDIDTGSALHAIADHTGREAYTQGMAWLRSVGAENPETYGERFAIRPKRLQPGEQNLSAPQDATQRVGSWSIYDVTLGREISRMDDVSFAQADARANELERSTGHNMSVRGLSENFADGKGPGRPGDSQRHGIPKGATIAELEKAAKAPGRKGQLARWQLNMRRGKKK